MNDPELLPFFSRFDECFRLEGKLGQGAFAATYLIRIKPNFKQREPLSASTSSFLIEEDDDCPGSSLSSWSSEGSLGPSGPSGPSGSIPMSPAMTNVAGLQGHAGIPAIQKITSSEASRQGISPRIHKISSTSSNSPRGSQSSTGSSPRSFHGSPRLTRKLPYSYPDLYVIKVFLPNDALRKNFSIQKEALLSINQRFANVVNSYGLYDFTSTSYLLNPLNASRLRPFTCICMDYVNGVTMEQLRHNSSALYPEMEATILCIFRQLMCGLHELHSHDIVHRDIKPANVMVRGNEMISLDGSQIKVIDLGFACTKSNKREDGTLLVEFPSTSLGTSLYPGEVRDPEAIDLTCRGQQGSPYYLAPELFANTNKYGKQIKHRSFKVEELIKADIWAAGVTMFWFIFQYEPFGSENNSFDLLSKNVLDNNRAAYDPTTFPRCIELINLCLTPDPTRRPTAEDIVQRIDTYFAGTP